MRSMNRNTAWVDYQPLVILSQSTQVATFGDPASHSSSCAPYALPHGLAWNSIVQVMPDVKYGSMVNTPTSRAYAIPFAIAVALQSTKKVNLDSIIENTSSKIAAFFTGSRAYTLP